MKFRRSDQKKPQSHLGLAANSVAAFVMRNPALAVLLSAVLCPLINNQKDDHDKLQNDARTLKGTHPVSYLVVRAEYHRNEQQYDRDQLGKHFHVSHLPPWPIAFDRRSDNESWRRRYKTFWKRERVEADISRTTRHRASGIERPFFVRELTCGRLRHHHCTRTRATRFAISWQAIPLFSPNPCTPATPDRQALR